METIHLSDNQIKTLLSWYEALSWGGTDDSELAKKLRDLQKAPDDIDKQIYTEDDDGGWQ